MEEFVPKETETIAAKRSARIARKIRATHLRLRTQKQWWNTFQLEIVILIFLIALNGFLVYDKIGTSAPEIPFSGPLVPLLTKLIQPIGYSFFESVQMVNIIFYTLFPLAYYFFIRSVTSRKIASIIATLIVSLPIYPFAQTRITASLHAYDSAHIVSLTIIPVALLGLHGFIRVGKVRNLIIASFFTMLVALTSPFGLLTYLIFSSILTFSEMLLGKGRLKVSRLLTVLLMGAGLSSFWYNPAFLLWLLMGPIGGDFRLTISKLIPISFFAVPILAVFGYLLFDRKPQLQSVFLASFCTIAFFIISTAGGGVFPSHPSRYVAELGISIGFLASIVVVRITDFVAEFHLNGTNKGNNVYKNARLNKNIAQLFLGAFIVLLVLGVVVGKGNTFSESKVLGTWTEVEKGEIWVAKDRFGGISTVIGYVISGVSVGTLGFVQRFSKKIDINQ